MIDPEAVLDKIIKDIKLTYKSGIIHGDLSEFNILIQENEDPIIIDWPQSISIEHPNSAIVIERDIKNILSFFKRKYKIEKELSKVLTLVKD